jgi:hypothetical protein
MSTCDDLNLQAGMNGNGIPGSGGGCCSCSVTIAAAAGGRVEKVVVITERTAGQTTARQIHTTYQKQCCGSKRFLTGSGSDIRKRPDPDPHFNKFSVKFLLETFLAEICSKKYIHDPKS